MTTFMRCIALLAISILPHAALATPAVLPAPDLSQHTFTNATADQVHMVGNDAAANVYLAGPFTAVDGVALPGLARLMADGSLDTAWVPPVPCCMGSTPLHVVSPAQAFAVINSTQVYRIDTSGSGTTATLFTTSLVDITALTTDPSGALYLGSVAGVARRLPDGTPDSSFDLRLQGSTTCGVPVSVANAMVHDGGRFLYVGGDFTQVFFNGVTTTVTSAFRIATDTATFDASWKPLDNGFGADSLKAAKTTCLPPDTANRVSSIAIPDDGFVYMGGYFVAAGVANSLARFKVDAPGVVDGLWLPLSVKGTVDRISIDRLRHRLYAIGELGSGTIEAKAFWLLPAANADPTWSMTVQAPPGTDSFRRIDFWPDRVFVGGNLTGFDSGAVSRINAAAFEPAGVSVLDHYYQSILGRAPDASGTAFWPKQVVQLTRKGVAAKEVYIAMAMFFFSSSEFAATPLTDAQFVDKLYQTFFNRPADAGGRDFWVGQIAAGLTREMVMFAFMFSNEFDTYMADNLDGPGNMRAEVGAVIDFYRGVLARLPDMGGLVSWVNQFRSAQCQSDALGSSYQTAIAMSDAFFNGAEYQSFPFTAPDYVSDLYNAFLRRGADPSGFNFWVNEISSGHQTPAQVRRAFIDSPEFGARVQAIAGAGCTQPMP